ncbi:WxL domain-containing protein [Levilactobacillus brevis]|uniref:WxL domain-containing protein n=1 Tax=Levilactobacillus brevis TaxID=1580 RepID=UPI003D17682D
MNKNVKSIVISTIVALGVMGTASLVANADSTAQTLGQISFKDDNTKPYEPVDPTDPTKPVDPEDPDNPGTGNTGSLALTVAPKAFNFGEQDKYSNEHTYYAQTPENGASKQYLQVNDNRDAGTQGWTLTAKQDRNLTDDSTSKAMTGVTFYIPKGDVYNSLNDNPTEANTAAGLSASSATVTPDNSTVVFQDNMDVTNSGKDVSTDVWNPTDVSLTIPRNTATSGNFSNHIVWTLTAAAK